MKVVEVVTRMGGIADARTLVAFTSRRKVRTALRKGVIVRDARGRFALPTAEQARRAANALSAVVSHASAAAHYGWEMKHPPERPTVTVPRNRNVPPARRDGINVKWRNLSDAAISRDGVTMPGQTVIDCACTMPFDEALAIADSALRHRAVTKEQLLRLAEQVPTTGRAACIRVVHAADARAANPFESVLRAIALDVPGLRMEPQVVLNDGGFLGRPDLVDEELRIVAEAESFEWHGKRKALYKDCARCNGLVRRGWVVLRFTWEHVMFEPAYVADCLADTAALRPVRRAARPVSRQKTA